MALCPFAETPNGRQDADRAPVRRIRGRSRYLSGPMAQDPDPTVELTTARGVTRTLDDWTTSFHLALTVLPGRPEAASYVRIGRRIAETLGIAIQEL